MSLIIPGAGGPEPKTATLPEVEIDLLPPSTAPEARPTLSEARVAELLAHEHPLVRQYAVEQAVHRRLPLEDALAARLSDVPDVAIPAIRGLEELQAKAQTKAIIEIVKTEQGEVLAAAAAAVATLDPAALVPAVQGRGRMDDEGFAGVMTSLAVVGTEEAAAFLDKALNRAGVQNPGRRASLYSAALLSGHPKLCQRTLGQALAESEREAPPEGTAYPTRSALAALAGGAPELALFEAHQELWAVADQALRGVALELLPEADRPKLDRAIPRRKLGEILEALAPIAELEIPEPQGDEDDTLGTMPQRRRGLLVQMVAQRAQLARLSPEAGGLFAAAAARAVAVMGYVLLGDTESPGVVAASKASDGALTTGLLSGTEQGLEDALGGMSARALRPVLVVLGREEFRKVSTLRRIAHGLLTSGHGAQLFETAAESQNGRFHGAVLRACVDAKVEAEAAALELLQAQPLDENAARFALVVALELRTTRIAHAVGRRFYALRALDSALVAQLVLRLGDARLLPLLESRAFADEAEETAFAVLGLVSDAPLEGKLAHAVERVQQDQPPAYPLQVPMQCANCGEILSYAFKHAYVDVEAKDDFGDPAFVGHVECKACGADALGPTRETAQILTAHMMQFLNEMRAGQVQTRPLVTPGQTQVGGKTMGIAKAMRTLADDIKAQPDTIRPRLHRARLGLLLESASVAEDLAKVEELDATSLEARAMKAHHLHVKGQSEAAVAGLAEVIRALESDDQPRLYDVPDARTLRESLEEFLVELSEEGMAVPADIDLSHAEARRDAREQAQAERMRQRQAGLG